MEEEQFGFRKGKGTRDAIGLIQTIGERYIEKDKDVYTVIVDLEKAFDRVDWKKLMGILKKIVVDWKERRLLSNLYMIFDALLSTNNRNPPELHMFIFFYKSFSDRSNQSSCISCTFSLPEAKLFFFQFIFHRTT